MDQRACDEGISISRNFEDRKSSDTERLYTIIKEAVVFIKEGTDEEQTKALAFITELFEPLMRKISSKIYNYLRGSLEYTDVLQETYTMFLTLLDRYNPERASFSYYIGSMLPQHMKRWAEKEVFHHNVNIAIDIKDYTIVDPLFNSMESVEEQLNAFVLTREYKSFIRKRAKRPSRSNTVREVCHKYFLGENTCQEIATDLGISYHAVYEIIGKIKDELRQFFHNSVFSEYYMTSTGGVYEGW